MKTGAMRFDEIAPREGPGALPSLRPPPLQRGGAMRNAPSSRITSPLIIASGTNEPSAYPTRAGENGPERNARGQAFLDVLRQACSIGRRDSPGSIATTPRHSCSFNAPPASQGDDAPFESYSGLPTWPS